jgi:hypothetical protein
MEDSLSDDEGQPLLQALLQPAQVAAGGVRVGAQHHHDPAVLDLDPMGADVVGEGVQSATRDQVEAGVMPVAGEQPVFYGAAVEGEPHVRAAVVDGIGLAVEQENAHGRRADLARQVPLDLEVVESTDPLPLLGPGPVCMSGWLHQLPSLVVEPSS